ncbi:MAG: hypothetical protein EXR93_00525 [Gemmatimonadetes bacterium]|nr:hypothetical protein [Gemmatimonadota bacterium]
MPPALRRRVESAIGLPGPGAESVADTLRSAAEGLLAEAAAAAPSRETALSLLAADALMTYACEAVAELAPERLGEMR